MAAAGWVRIGALAALLATAGARAEMHGEVALGYTDEIEGERAPVAAIALVTESKNPYELMLGYIPQRGDLSSSKDTVFLSFGKRLTFGRWFFSSGIAAAKGDDEVLSGTFQFLTGVSYKRDRWTLGLRHLSNAGLTGRNRGETFLLATWAW